ncbi:hypothetical protein ABT187_37325 [Streptomyces sp. NPDC001817]|uniref:hypothetical protein n=1 Tax=Streptomyces sp. NPDC001817 TaxID=3154398 RepID=UPI00331EF98B
MLKREAGMEVPQEVATPDVRMNWAAVAASVLAAITALCALAARTLAARANTLHDESAGVLSLMAMLASFVVAVPAVVLGIRGIVTRTGSRGLGLSIASIVVAGAWALFGVAIWIGLTAGVIR